MIGYLFGGAFLTGVGIGVISYLHERNLYRKFERAAKTNEELFNKLSDKDVSYLKDCIKKDLEKGKDLSSKL